MRLGHAAGAARREAPGVRRRRVLRPRRARRRGSPVRRRRPLHRAALGGGALRGALARRLATSFAAFEAGVFVNGVGMGLALMSVPAYAGELSPSSLHRGLTSHPDGFVCLGCILGGLCFSPRFLNLPVRVAWRLTVATGTAIPALLGFAVLLMPELPQWLLTKDHARRVLSRTLSLEDAELRLLETKTELGEPHDVGCDDTVATPAWRTRWREERALWLELLARPTEPVRRNIVSALVAKAFQQASGIGSMFLYVQRAFRDAGVPSDTRMTRALVAFGLVVFAFFAVSTVLLELAWLLVKALAGGCCRGARRRRAGAGRPPVVASRPPWRRCHGHEAAAGAAEVGEEPVRDHADVADGAGVALARPRADGGRVVVQWLAAVAADRGGRREPGRQGGDPVELRVGLRGYSRVRQLARVLRDHRVRVVPRVFRRPWRQGEVRILSR